MGKTSSPSILEYQSLRQEILLRIAMQNALLALSVTMFLVTATASIFFEQAGSKLGLIYTICAGLLSLVWIHSGARTLQIKTYLTEVVEPEMGGHLGWEHWHAINRVAGILGSRWFISTKGLFVGSQIAAIALPWLSNPQGNERFLAVLSILVMLATTLTLLVSPKMSLTRTPTQQQTPRHGKPPPAY